MTTLTTTPTATLSSRTAMTIGVASAVVAATLATLFAHGWGEVAVVVPLIAVVTAGVFGYVVPRALRRSSGGESSGGTALALAVPAALLVVPAFWSGLPLVLGVGAVIVGNAGRSARAGSGKAITGLVLGALTALFHLSIYVMEGSAGHTGFLFD